jgi:hypothetical protein
MLQDLRLALRLFRRTPLSTGVALLSITLSVGATAIVFTAVKAVLLDPLPYAHPERLVQIRSENPKAQRQALGDWVVWNDVQELPRRTRTLESLAAYANAMFDLAGGRGVAPEALYSDPGVVDRTVNVNGHACRVIGVMPPEFNFPMRRTAAHTPSPYVEFWAAPLITPRNPNAGRGAIARLSRLLLYQSYS